MEFFPIVTLVIATFLLLIGIVGRGASMGSSQFHITLEGSIGRLPRVAILAVSIVTYGLAIFGFIYVAQSNSEPKTTPTTPVTSVASTESPSSQIAVNVVSELWEDEGVVEERDEISIAGSDPLVLTTNENDSSATDVFYLDKAVADLEVNYSVKIVVTYSDGTVNEYEGRGALVAQDGQTFSVTLDRNGVPALE
ncbi:hypothetical protein [Streptomyces sp. NBC_00572]|uniref:hypothetical protein n=1 Tax=Streptomyces sp. NBC_00572 TaxID=2903664 RepID=UPI00225BED09|nr:hypothetical protein [Streptomyces sp. NBC_00572]MCX4982216.1 hypothetical protein [Streptomyces sp. NBC_00572]